MKTNFVKLIIFSALIAIGTVGPALAMSKKKSEPETIPSIQAKDTVWVAKAASTKQCEKKESKELEAETDMLHNDLVEKKIWVLNRKLVKDRALQTQQCGAPSGELHGFLIQKKDLDTALEIGFRKIPTP